MSARPLASTMAVLGLLLSPLLANHPTVQAFAQEDGDALRRGAVSSPGARSVREIERLLGRPGEERKLSGRLAARERRALGTLARQLREGRPYESVRPGWESLLEHVRPNEGEVDVLARWLLRTAYLERSAALERFVEKARAYGEAKVAVRKEVARLRRTSTRLSTPGGSGATFTPDPEVATLLGPSGGGPAATTKTVALSRRAELEAYELYLEQGLADLEAELGDLAKAAELTQTDLQHALEKQQEMMQYISNLMRSLHDTAKSLIKNLKS